MGSILRSTLICSTFCVGVTAFSQQQNSQQPSTLPSPRAIFINLSESLKVYSFQQKKRIIEWSLANQKKKIDDIGLWPQLETSGSLARRIPETDRNVLVSAKLNYQLYDFGRNQAKVDESSFDAELKSLKIKQGEDLISWEIAQSILQIINAKKIKDIYGSIVTAATSKRQTIESGVRQGLRPTYDLKVSELEGAQYSLALTRAQGDLEQAISQLDGLVNNNDHPQLRDIVHQLASQLPTLTQGSHSIPKHIQTPTQWFDKLKLMPVPKSDWTEMISSAQKAKIKASYVGLEAQNAPELLVGLEANYGGSWTETTPSYVAQLTLKWLIPWSGRQNLEKEQINLQSKSIDTDYEAEKSAKAAALQYAEKEIQTLRNAWDQLEQLYSLRKEIHRLTLERYRVGKASSLEVTQLELDLSNLLVEKIRTSNRGREVALKVAMTQNLVNPANFFEDSWE